MFEITHETFPGSSVILAVWPFYQDCECQHGQYWTCNNKGDREESRPIWGLVHDGKNGRYIVCKLWGENGKIGIRKRERKGRYPSPSLGE